MLKTNCKLFITCIVILSSCSYERANRIMYATPAANVPYLTQKGDAKITGYYSSNSFGNQVGTYNPSYGGIKNSGADVQGAYAITDHWSILAGFSYKAIKQSYNYDTTKYYGGYGIFAPGRTQTNIFDSSVIKYNSSFFQIGAGYSMPLNQRKHISFNLYGGIDIGRLTMHDAGFDSSASPYTRYYSVNTNKPWLQAAFNFGDARTAVGVSLGGRLSLLHFGNPNTTYQPDELSYFYLDKIANQTYFLWEPYVNFQASIPSLNWLRFDGQLSFCSGFNEYYPKASIINGSIGVTVNLLGVLHKAK